MCFVKKKIKPVQGVVEISRAGYMQLSGLPPISPGNPPDDTYWLVPKSELTRIGTELVYPATWYIENLWDCDKYAMQGMLDARRIFGACVQFVFGDVPGGYHGFDFAIDLDGHSWILENNAGFPHAGVWYPAKSNDIGYVPKKLWV